MVGRRKSNHHLPARMYEKNGGFYFVDPARKWHFLKGTGPIRCMCRYYLRIVRVSF